MASEWMCRFGQRAASRGRRSLERKRSRRRRAEVGRELSGRLQLESLEARTLMGGLAELVEDSIPGGGINPVAVGSFPGGLTTVNGTLYFNANDGYGAELWRINASGQAEMVEDVLSGRQLSDPANATAIGGALYFSA